VRLVQDRPMAFGLEGRSTGALADADERSSGLVCPFTGPDGLHDPAGNYSMAHGAARAGTSSAAAPDGGDFAGRTLLQFLSSRIDGWRPDEGLLCGPRNA